MQKIYKSHFRAQSNQAEEKKYTKCSLNLAIILSSITLLLLKRRAFKAVQKARWVGGGDGRESFGKGWRAGFRGEGLRAPEGKSAPQLSAPLLSSLLL